ncbi:MAG: arsenate reductase family protein [Bacteroidota bacterium]|nr:arsenate reductase family protein [Bacteroidota bacterium]
MAKNKVTIYHKSSCSKSNCALNWLHENGYETEIREYLKEVPTKKELKEILAKLGAKPIDIVRKKEPLFIEKFKGKNFTDAEWLQILIENPNLIERPIVVDGYNAIIARPHDVLEDFLNRKKK